MMQKTKFEKSACAIKSFRNNMTFKDTYRFERSNTRDTSFVNPSGSPMAKLSSNTTYLSYPSLKSFSDNLMVQLSSGTSLHTRSMQDDIFFKYIIDEDIIHIIYDYLCYLQELSFFTIHLFWVFFF